MKKKYASLRREELTFGIETIKEKLIKHAFVYKIIAKRQRRTQRETEFGKCDLFFMLGNSTQSKWSDSRCIPQGNPQLLIAQ